MSYVAVVVRLRMASGQHPDGCGWILVGPEFAAVSNPMYKKNQNKNV